MNLQKNRLLRATLLLVAYGVLTPGERVNAQVTVDDFQAAAFTDTNVFSLPYRLFTPAVYSQQPMQSFPLVLFLHGAGQTGTDNRGQLTGETAPLVFVQPANQAVNPCFMVAPQYPPNAPWVNVPLYSQNYSVVSTPESLSLLAAVHLVQSLQQQYRIDPSRVYITGLSMGAIGTWDALIRHPGLFAAAVPIAGYGDPSQVEVIKNQPVWAFHNDGDTTVPVAGSISMISALQAAGDTKALLTLYPAIGHDAWDAAYTDPNLQTWLFGQSSASVFSSVSGTLTLDGIAANAAARSIGFAFRDASGNVLLRRTASVLPDGTYSFTDIPAGQYTVHIQGSGYLAANIAVDTTTGNVTGADATLPGGDANGDNRVDVADFGLVVNAFGSTATDGSGSYNANADFNGDGMVDIGDFGILTNNYGETGEN